MLFSIIHTTTYKYNNVVTYCHNIANIKPMSFLGQELVDYKLEISPEPSNKDETIDFFKNATTHFSIEQEHKELIVTARSLVKRDHTLEPNIYNSKTCQETKVKDGLEKLKKINDETIEVKQYMLDSELIKNTSSNIKDYALTSFKPERSIFDAANDLMKRIFTDFKFDPKFSTVATPLDEVMKEKKGVCQDFAHIAIACVRAVGLPARYVSGYIETLPPPGKEKLVGTDASHAWFSIYIPEFGWVDFDPTNNQIPKDQHITVAYGRDYYDLPPLKGIIYGSGTSKMEVSVDIRPAKTNTL